MHREWSSTARHPAGQRYYPGYHREVSWAPFSSWCISTISTVRRYYVIEAIKKFADDTKLGNGAESAESRKRLHDTLDHLVEWARIWGMEFNLKKCKVMRFGQANPKHVYRMGDHPLEETLEETDIGVVVNPSLKPAAQCRKVARTAQTVLAQITRGFHFRDRNIFMRLYT